MTDFILSFGIPLAYVALGVAALGAIIFPLVYMFKDLKKAKAALMGIGILIVVFVLCYVLSKPEALGTATGGQMRVVEASLYVFYILLAGSIIAILYATVSRYFK